MSTPAMTSPVGLSAAEALRRLREGGLNEIARAASVSPLRLLLRQFKGVMTALLLGASLLSLALGEVLDGVAIAAILVINGLVGFFQEHRAERAVLALRAMAAPRATVVRDGRAIVIPASEVVVGDVLQLEAGDIVAADATLVEAHGLSCNEAALTGESLPVEKQAGGPIDGALAERRGEVFTGATVATGSGRAEVVATGMRTELGRIAHLLDTAVVEPTPLQVRLAQAARVLAAIAVGIVGLVVVLGLVRGERWLDLVLAGISLAVAAVPEGLAAIVTVALAIGVQRMAARSVLVRRLPAVETLGCATVICTDKTGTLTTGVMAVREIWAPDHVHALTCAAACCDAELAHAGAAGPATGTGDPTELAILAAAHARGIERDHLERACPRVEVHPFDAERKRMSIRRADGRLYVKGAVDLLWPLCARGTEGALEANAAMARRGLRVLAVAVGRGPEERDLELVGLLGLADPPRTEAVTALAAARGAGVRTVMITGDHPVTAAAVAREMGLVRPGDDEGALVHARATPEDKLRIVRELKRRGEVVAMTGDGVNDAPALREAHIGIAMGRGGTEVTREASSMILTDDNYASIVGAIREGRGIYENIRKTVVYLLAGNAGELLVVLGASLAALPIPLLPLQLLWINLVTDGLPALALVMDPAPSDVLARPPRRPDEPMLGRREWVTVVGTGLLQAGVTLATFAWALEARGLVEARNLAFSVLVFGELFRAFAARSQDRVLWQVGLFSNARLLAIVVVSALVQLGLHHIPFTQALFGLGAISLADCAATIALGLVPVTVVEVAKLVRGAWRRDRGPVPVTRPTSP